MRVVCSFVVLLAFGACAGKRGTPATPASTRVMDSAPERVAASRAAGTGGESELMEERFGNEAATEKRREREAAKRPADGTRVEVVEDPAQSGTAPR